jgi:hypothetical protein
MGIPRPKTGQIKGSYGKLAHNDPDVIVAWGDKVALADRAVVLYHLNEIRKDLEPRGYDITTIRFSISKTE